MNWMFSSETGFCVTQKKYQRSIVISSLRFVAVNKPKCSGWSFRQTSRLSLLLNPPHLSMLLLFRIHPSGRYLRYLQPAAYYFHFIFICTFIYIFVLTPEPLLSFIPAVAAACASKCDGSTLASFSGSVPLMQNYRERDSPQVGLDAAFMSHLLLKVKSDLFLIRLCHLFELYLL